MPKYTVETNGSFSYSQVVNAETAEQAVQQAEETLSVTPLGETTITDFEVFTLVPKEPSYQSFKDLINKIPPSQEENHLPKNDCNPPRGNVYTPLTNK